MTSNKESIIQSRFDGDEEAYRAWLRQNAARGGSKKVKKGYGTLSKTKRAQKAREGAKARWQDKHD